MTDGGHRYSCLMPVRGFLSHKAFLIGHDRSFWLPDLIYTSPQNICCSASLHRVLSYALLKVVAVSTRGSRGSVTTDKGGKTNTGKCNTRKCVNVFDLKGSEGDCSSSSYQCMVGLFRRHFCFPCTLCHTWCCHYAVKYNCWCIWSSITVRKVTSARN